MAQNLNPVRTLLGDMSQDDYVKFKYGKRVEAALKLLDHVATGPDTVELEGRLLELLDLVRGTKAKAGRGKKGAGASAPEVKRPERARKAETHPVVTA